MKSIHNIKKPCLIALVLALILCPGVKPVLSAVVDGAEAIAVADLWYAMEVNSDYIKITQAERNLKLEEMYKRQVFYLVSKDDLLDAPPVEEPVLAYVVVYEPSGFVVVSGEDRIFPIVVFDAQTEFRWDEPERNFLRYFLGKTMISRWDSLSAREEKGEMVYLHPMWDYLRSRLQEARALLEVGFEEPEAVFVQWDTALWGQWWPYNTVAVANNGNNNVPTGCTATAMAIKMRFHSWPTTGNSSHSYTDNSGSIRYSHSVNFGAHTYSWAAMPTTTLTTTNDHVANLMYHCGVAVNMNYELGGSGAWPTASSMNTYFRYKGTIDRYSSHEGPMSDSILAALPVVLSSSTHTVVADGYRDTVSPYFHINAGWNGSSNGWYNLDQIPGTDKTIDRSYPYCSPNNYIYLNGNWTGSENGNLQNPYNTLSEGNAAVPTNGHLWIKAGSYSGSGNTPITFTKAMSFHTYQGTVTIGN